MCSASCKPERRRKLQADSDAQCTGFNEQASNGKSNFSSVLFLGNRRKKHLFTQWSRDILAKSLTAVTPQRYSGNPKHDTMLKQKAGHTLVVCKTFFFGLWLSRPPFPGNLLGRSSCTKPSFSFLVLLDPSCACGWGWLCLTMACWTKAWGKPQPTAVICAKWPWHGRILHRRLEPWPA